MKRAGSTMVLAAVFSVAIGGCAADKEAEAGGGAGPQAKGEVADFAALGDIPSIKTPGLTPSPTPEAPPPTKPGGTAPPAVIPSPVPKCGDKMCEKGYETCATCPYDCGECPKPPQECPADLDDNGFVEFLDLLILLANYGS